MSYFVESKLDRADRKHGTVTNCLLAVENGHPSGTEDLFSLVYVELRKIAFSRLKQSPQHATVQATSLVNEAYVRLFKDENPSWENRHHFYWAAARAMRDVLVEHARKSCALKRGGGRVVIELDESRVPTKLQEASELLGLDEAITKLESERAIAAQIVILKFYGGLTRSQIADQLELSESAVWREWEFAKAWLHSALS